MSEYLLIRTSSIGPDFNQASDILKQKDLGASIKGKLNNELDALLVEIDDQKVDSLKSQLKGWDIGPFKSI